MYISKIQIQNYKSIKDLTIQFDENFNILIGKNGVGKTAIFEAIQNLIFKKIGNLPERIILEFVDQEYAIAEKIWEPISKIYQKDGEARMILRKMFLQIKKYSLVYEKNNNIFYICADDIFILSGIITYKEPPLSGGKSEPIDNISEDTIKKSQTLKEILQKAIKKEMIGFSLNPDPCQIVLEFLQTHCVFTNEIRDPKRENKEYTHMNKKSQNPDSSNKNFIDNVIDTSSWLDQLFMLQNSIDINRYAIVQEFEDLCYEEGYTVRAIKENGDSIRLKIFYRKNKVITTNALLPSGLSQQILFNFILAFSKNKILFLEEPENNLHPSLQKQLFAMLRRREKGQTFITTHSEEFLDYETFEKMHFVLLDYKNKTIVKSAKELLNNSQKQEDLIFQSSRSFYHIDKRCFFSDFVVLCEGGSEYTILPIIFRIIKRKENYFENRNIMLIDAGGYPKVHFLSKCLSLFGIPYVAFVDEDKGKDKRAPGFNVSNKIFVYPFEDFDECYIPKLKEEVGYSSEKCEKLNFALKVISKSEITKENLEETKSELEILKKYFTEEAAKSFLEFVNHFEKEYQKSMVLLDEHPIQRN